MDTTTIFRGCGSCTTRHAAIKPIEPLGCSSFPDDLPEMPTSSFLLEATEWASSSYDLCATAWVPSTAGLTELAERAGLDLYAPIDQEYDDLPNGKVPNNPGGDWGTARHLSRPDKWWERDLKTRRQQLEDMELKHAVLGVNSMRRYVGFSRLPPMSRTYTPHREESVQTEHEREVLPAMANTVQQLEKKVEYTQPRYKHHLDMLRHALHYNLWDRDTISKVDAQKQYWKRQAIHFIRELSWAKADYKLAKPKQIKKMTARWDLCKPREVPRPVSKPSPVDTIIDAVKPHEPLEDAEALGTTKPSLLWSMLAMCVVS